MEKDCIFCRIVRLELEASVIYEDQVVLAFLDIRPVNSGHSLVIPNRHASYLADLGPEEGSRMFETARSISAALRRTDLPCDGVNLFLADGEAAGQDVFHVHLHVIPRLLGDDAGYKLPPGYGAMPPRSELDEVATRIRRQLVR